ncbi:MAG TPA: NB-ARC domain-containing protein, partial [Candidatus Acidoferrales bacterium]|nr:NB-ARC domain-containing protein [Candidatus Acidoferrales bacterium]
MQQTQAELRPERGIPRYATETIGRAGAIDEIGRLLARSCLATIVGPGGIGKTRIATEVARADESRATAFVDLEPIRDPQLVVSTVAAAVGADLGGTSDPEMALANLLGQQSMLLVLDNCEHVLRPVSSLCRALLAHCSRLRILATSREAFGIDGESVFVVGALDDGASVRLFIERAGERADAFSKSPSDLAVITQVCRRLDGIPLAIELAAARIDGLTPEELLASLKERFRLLNKNKSEAKNPHHRTLRALIDWSYDLLSEEERTAFTRLGVFRGEFSRDAAREVIGTGVDLDVLARKSLIAASIGAQDRFRMYESMREYAILHLHVSDAEPARRAHAVFFANLAAAAASDFGTVPEDVWLSRYLPDLDNFRTALSWMQRCDLTLGAATIGDLKELWFHGNLSYEGLSRSQMIVAALRPDDDRALGPLLAVASLAWRVGEFKVSYEAAKRAATIAERTNNARAIAQARYSIGWALFKLGDTEQALPALRLAVDEYRALDEPLRTLLVE